MKVFLGGSKTAVMLPRELTELIDSYCQQKASFLIGDCFGADQLMQEYLYERGYADVTVFVSGDHVRHHSGTYPIRHIPAEGFSGFDFYCQKDFAMIEECDCAVMLWDGKTRGTRLNIWNMESLRKQCIVIMFDTPTTGQ